MSTRLAQIRERAEYQAPCAYEYRKGGVCGRSADNWPHWDESDGNARHSFRPGPPTDLQLLLYVAEAAKALVDDSEAQAGGWGPDVTMLVPLVAALAPLLEGAPG